MHSPVAFKLGVLFNADFGVLDGVLGVFGVLGVVARAMQK